MADFGASQSYRRNENDDNNTKPEKGREIVRARSWKTRRGEHFYSSERRIYT
jgi:hypothetical protein